MQGERNNVQCRHGLTRKGRIFRWILQRNLINIITRKNSTLSNRVSWHNIGSSKWNDDIEAKTSWKSSCSWKSVELKCMWIMEICKFTGEGTRRESCARNDIVTLWFDRAVAWKDWIIRGAGGEVFEGTWWYECSLNVPRTELIRKFHPRLNIYSRFSHK